MSGPRPRAVVYRAIGLGDLLAGVPALRALRRALPDHELVLCAPAAQAGLVALVDAVDRHLPTAELAPVDWDGPPPDVAVDLHGNGPASRHLLEALHPARFVRFGPGGSRWDPDEHERARWCRLVEEGLGPVRADPDDVRLPPPAVPAPVAGAVVVHPGAASPSRRWPEERYAEVAAALAADGHTVVLTGSPSERPIAERVRRLAGLPDAALLAGDTDLVTLAALVASARLVVSGDTGTAHLASAYATPSVVLFGPTPPSRWGPPPGPHAVLWHGPELVRGGGDQTARTYVGDPHAATPDPALLAILVPEVLTASRRICTPTGRRVGASAR